MKTRLINIFPAAILAAILFFAFFSSCSKNELIEPSNKNPEAQMKVISTVYSLSQVSSSGVSGTATLQQVGHKTKVTIQVTGTMKGSSHPSHIHFSSTGGVAYPLNDVNGVTGMSTTMLDVSYQDLLNFDGYINIHQSATNLATIISQGDIGIGDNF